MTLLSQIFQKCINEDLGSCFESFLSKFVNLFNKINIKTEVVWFLHFRTISLNLELPLFGGHIPLIFLHRVSIHLGYSLASLVRYFLLGLSVVLRSTDKYLKQQRRTKGQITQLLFFSFFIP